MPDLRERGRGGSAGAGGGGTGGHVPAGAAGADRDGAGGDAGGAVGGGEHPAGRRGARRRRHGRRCCCTRPWWSCTRSTGGPPRWPRPSPGGEGETRTLDQVRADVVCDLLIDGTTATPPRQARGIRAHRRGDRARCCPSSTTRPRRPRIFRWWRVSGRSRCPGRGSCAGVTGRGCGCSPTPRPGWSSPSDATIPAPRRVEQTREVAGGSVHGPRLRDARLPVRHRPQRGLGRRRRDVADNNAPFCEGHHTVRHHGGWHIRQTRRRRPSNGPHPPDGATPSTPNAASPSSAPTPPPAPNPPHPSDLTCGGIWRGGAAAGRGGGRARAETADAVSARRRRASPSRPSTLPRECSRGS